MTIDASTRLVSTRVSAG